MKMKCKKTFVIVARTIIYFLTSIIKRKIESSKKEIIFTFQECERKS